jgi:hypothetical protein
LSGLLVAAFAWVQIKNFPVIAILENTKPQSILQLALAGGFASWAAAISFDLSTQQAVYVDDPDEGRITFELAGAMILLTAVAGGLLWASNDEKRFALAIDIYILGNIVFWRLLLRRAKAVIEASKAFYRDEDLFELEKLNVLETYVGGHWQWYRFGVMFAIAIILDAVCFVAPLRDVTALGVHFLFPNFSAAAASSLLPVIAFVGLLLVAESWVWLMRAKTRTCIGVIDGFRRRYKLALLEP